MQVSIYPQVYQIVKKIVKIMRTSHNQHGRPLSIIIWQILKITRELKLNIDRRF